MNPEHQPTVERRAEPRPRPRAEAAPVPQPAHSSRASDVAVLLPLLGLFLLMPPMIALFAIDLDIVGLPLIVVYVFGVWLALVASAALLARRLAAPTTDRLAEGRAD